MGWTDIKKDDLTHLSNTQVAMYQRCPLQYKFRYVDGKKTPPDSGLILGLSVHKGIEVNYKEKFKTMKAANKHAVMDAYSDQFESSKHGVKFEEPSGKVKDLGYAMSQVHYDDVAPSVQPVEPPELGFEIEVPGLKRKLKGYIDVIGRLINGFANRAIIDNKTTRRKFTEFEVGIAGQLTTYAYVHRKLFPKRPADAVGFDVIVGNKYGGASSLRIMSERDGGQLQRFEETIRGVERGIQSGIFYPTDNPMTCSWCGYNKICHSKAVEIKNRQREG